MMHFFQVDAVRYAQFERLREQDGLAHAFTLRPDDVSLRLDDDSAQRDVRRRRMARALDLNASDLCCCEQVHDTRLVMVDRDRPRGRVEKTDALITGLKRVPLMCFSADCPLVLAYDPRKRAVGLVHSSWRCTVAGATRRLIEAMGRHFESKPADVLAGIGPSAGPCCYEVRQDLYDAAVDLPNRRELFVQREGRLYFDLWRANRSQLRSAGVPAAQIETAEICTMCRNDLFYSYRRDGAGCGHFGLMAGLRDAGV